MRKEKLSYLPGSGISVTAWYSTYFPHVDRSSFSIVVRGRLSFGTSRIVLRHPLCHLSINIIRISSTLKLSPRCRTSHAMAAIRSKPCILKFLDRSEALTSSRVFRSSRFAWHYLWWIDCSCSHIYHRRALPKLRRPAIYIVWVWICCDP